MTVLLRIFSLPLVLLVSLGLSGCGGLGDVAFEGKVFDALGANSTSKREEAKLAARAPLVMPPATGALPKPGEAQNPGDQAIAGIHDPEVTKAADKEQLATAQKAYCDKHYDADREAFEPTGEEVVGPAGKCRKSIFDNVSVNSGLSF